MNMMIKRGSSVHNATVLMPSSKGSIDTGKGYMVLLTLSSHHPAIGWERCHQKRTKCQGLHAPLMAVTVLPLPMFYSLVHTANLTMILTWVSTQVLERMVGHCSNNCRWPLGLLLLVEPPHLGG